MEVRPQRLAEIDQKACDRQAAVRRRTELEARLLAYRCGWLARDEIEIRKLERELDRILKGIGDDALARRLIDDKGT